MATSSTLVRLQLALVCAATLGLTGCLEPGPKYHGQNHKFSWQEEEKEGRKTADREDLIYVQPPRADYGSRK
jgi:hypothetical protein